MKIRITKVKGYEFEGYVYQNELSPAMLDSLRMTLDTEYDIEVKVEGTFSVDSNGYDEANVDCIESVYLIGTPNGKTYKGPLYNVQYSDIDNRMSCYKTVWGDIPATHDLELKEDDFDTDDLVSQIEDSGCQSDWCQDKMESLADAAYESYRESQWE